VKKLKYPNLKSKFTFNILKIKQIKIKSREKIGKKGVATPLRGRGWPVMPPQNLGWPASHTE
jgi:hypothetical protein